MGDIRDAIVRLSQIIDQLEPYSDEFAVAPEPETFYRTFNDSLVYVTAIDDDGDGVVLVIRGGHGEPSSAGEKPGERYYVDESGYFKSLKPGVEVLMSLREVLDTDF